MVDACARCGRHIDVSEPIHGRIGAPGIICNNCVSDNVPRAAVVETEAWQGTPAAAKLDNAPRATVAWSPDSDAPCNCIALKAVVDSIREGGARVAAFEGTGCAQHGWSAVQL